MFLNHILLGFLGIAFGRCGRCGNVRVCDRHRCRSPYDRKGNRARIHSALSRRSSLDGILGNIVSVFLQMHIPLGQVSGHIFLGLYGLSAGMFVGCIAVALAEILNTFPILFRRAKLKVGLQWVMWTMAVGKTCGALYYFVKKIGEGLS